MKRVQRAMGFLCAALLLVSASGCGGAPPRGEITILEGGGAENAAMDVGDPFMDGAASSFNTEEYSAITENGYRSAAASPLSTFSADVDTASYSNVRRILKQDGDVPADAVRLEEFINYFHYDYPPPEGEDPFSVTIELSQCPWNANTKLMLVGLQARDIAYADLPASNLVFLLDVSGSMYSPDKLPLVQRAFTMLAENLRPQDRVSIVTYAGSDRVVLEGAGGGGAMAITQAIASLEAGGGTAGARGIETAYAIAEKYFIEGGNNRVILATDGDLNIGVTSEGDLKRLVEKKREMGVFLSVLGFGTGNIKDNKMEALADNGNGNYAYIDSVQEARRVLVEQMGGTLFTVAKDVKIQVEFNPAHLKGYRLIGYENRLLNSEDFDDDKKDAGEIGAGHRVTALYELVETNSMQEVGGAELKYGAPAGSESPEWLTVRLRYQEPEGGESRLIERAVDGSMYTADMPQNLDFAAGVAQFGMLLRESPYAGTSTYREIYDRLARRPDVMEDEYKAEFLGLVKDRAIRD